MDDLDPNSEDNKVFETEPGSTNEGFANFSAQAQKDQFIGGSSSESDKSPLPGKPNTPKPIRIGNEVYSGLKPPKLYVNEDGTEEYRGGKRLDQAEADAEYAARYWERSKKGRTSREAMMDIIEGAVEKGVDIGSFVSPEGISDFDREKLSAYRQLAREMGYEVGEYKFNKQNHTATAEIRKKPK